MLYISKAISLEREKKKEKKSHGYNTSLSNGGRKMEGRCGGVGVVSEGLLWPERNRVT